MTPSEIAEWLDAADRAYNAAGSSTSAHPTDKFAQAAATIRAQAEALKIATEALSPFAEASEELPDDARCTYSLWESAAAAMLDASDLRRASKALSRIKEVSQ